MKRIRRLGIAVLATLALTTAFSASAASADDWTWFRSEVETTELKGVATELHVINVGWMIGCSSSSFAATMNALPEMEPGFFVRRDVTTSSLEYSSCGESGNNKINTNGCQYTLEPKLKTGANTFEGVFDIVCPPEKTMTYTYFAGCTVSIHPKSGLLVAFENVGTGKNRAIKIFPKATGLKYTDPCFGGGENGTYKTGAWEMKGYSGGQQVGIWLEGQGQGESPFGPGIFIGGKQSENPDQQPKFKAEDYPRTISGTQSPTNVFTTEGGDETKCESASFDTALPLTAISKLPVGAEYGGCTTYLSNEEITRNSTLSMNSCQFVISVANSGPPYVGSQEIDCEKEGDAITIAVRAFFVTVCTMSFPEQTVGSTAYENLGAGTGRHIVAESEGEGLEYTITHNTEVCPMKQGVHEDGTFSGGIDFVGVSS